MKASSSSSSLMVISAALRLRPLVAEVGVAFLAFVVVEGLDLVDGEEEDDEEEVVVVLESSLMALYCWVSEGRRRR